VLDALLGYSQHGDPRGEAADLIRWSSGRRVLALDVPSGLESSSTRAVGNVVDVESVRVLRSRLRSTIPSRGYWYGSGERRGLALDRPTGARCLG
jgi:hypothetical protein